MRIDDDVTRAASSARSLRGLAAWYGGACAMALATSLWFGHAVVFAHAMPPAEDARLVYLRDCATCHGASAQGSSRGPSLVDKGSASVDFMLTTGRMPLPSPEAEMRRRPPKYSTEMTRALVDYVSTLVSGGPEVPDVDPTAGDAAEGGDIYRRQCAACHQSAGQGGILIGQETPSLESSTPVQVVEATRTGPGTMPVFGASAITDEDLVSVVAYVQALRSPRDPGGQALWHLGPLPEGAAALCALGAIIVALRFIGSRS